MSQPWDNDLLVGLTATGAFISSVALVMTLVNLRWWPRPEPASADDAAWANERVVVCIPARNEAANLEEIVGSLLRQTHPQVYVLVYDDGSTDGTAEVLTRLTTQHPRVLAALTQTLPRDWNGKQHACHQMAQQAQNLIEPGLGEPWFLFTDADVRFEPQCVTRTVATALALRAPMVSGFPREIACTWAELLTVPMIFFILLSYLPFPRMRRSNDPSASAGCGQFLFIRADVYRESGGHAGFRGSMHDGIKLPRAVRRAGHHTELFDATDLCACRMYSDARQVWRGFTKNAYEGLGSVALLILITVLHAVGHLLPFIVLLLAMSQLLAGVQEGARGLPWGPLPASAVVLSGISVAMTLVQRVLIARRTRHPLWIVLLHPVSILALAIIQWYSFYLHCIGRRTWRGRTAR